MTHMCISSKILHKYIINIIWLHMTAHAMVWHREKGLAVGTDGCVTKPIRAEELFAVIEELNEE